MAITYPLTFPTHFGIEGITITPAAAVSMTQSPFTFRQQVQEHPGQRWQVDVKLPMMERDDAEPYTSFLLSLNGRRGTFLIGDPAAKKPRGSAGVTPGTPLVRGAGQSGLSLAIDGCPNSVTGYLKAGDYIQLGAGASSRLHKVLSDVNTNSSGQTTLDLWPRLRESPSDNAPITLLDCKGVFRLATNDMPWSIKAPYLYDISFKAVEAI